LKNKIIITITAITISYTILFAIKNVNWNRSHSIGEVVDFLNGVKVYYNGGVSNSEGRNLTQDGYNIGVKYQCVEFIKRYYFEHLHHKMPDTYGNAVDYFDATLKDSCYNKKRDLIQSSNPSKTKPKENDIIIFDKTIFNRYGHVAIISKVEDSLIEIIQQNPGPFASSREKIKLKRQDNLWLIDNKRILGRLTKSNP
jgi:surface antigen